MAKRYLVGVLCVFALWVIDSTAIAQSNFPSKPIRMVVPLTAGGGVDLMARITAQRLSEQLGQQIIVENQGGAGVQLLALQLHDPNLTATHSYFNRCRRPSSTRLFIRT